MAVVGAVARRRAACPRRPRALRACRRTARRDRGKAPSSWPPRPAGWTGPGAFAADLYVAAFLTAEDGRRPGEPRKRGHDPNDRHVWGALAGPAGVTAPVAARRPFDGGRGPFIGRWSFPRLCIEAASTRCSATRRGSGSNFRNRNFLPRVDRKSQGAEKAAREKLINPLSAAERHAEARFF